MSMNPYQAPVSTTTDVPIPADAEDYTGKIARCPAADGVTWIRDGWEMFKAHPGTWIGLALIFGALLLVVNLIPFIGGFISNVLLPILFGGLMLACDTARRGEAPTIGQLFEGFSRQTGQLALIGVIYLGTLIGGFMIVGIIAGIAIPAFALDLEGWMSSSGYDSGVLAIVLIVLVALALTVPLLMSVWFAPALVILHGVPAFEAMKRSFLGCLVNVVPFIVYGLVGLLLSIVATLPLMLGWLIVGPIVIGSAYSGYRRIYCSA